MVASNIALQCNATINGPYHLVTREFLVERPPNLASIIQYIYQNNKKEKYFYFTNIRAASSIYDI